MTQEGTPGQTGRIVPLGKQTPGAGEVGDARNA
jgi:hypothetical protein